MTARLINRYKSSRTTDKDAGSQSSQQQACLDVAVEELSPLGGLMMSPSPAILGGPSGTSRPQSQCEYTIRGGDREQVSG